MKSISLPMFRALVSGKAALVDLVEIYFSRQVFPDLLLALHDSAVVWNSRQYLAAGARPVSVSRSSRDQVNDVSLVIPDVYDDIARAMQSLDMGGTPVIIRQVFRGQAVSSTDSFVRYAGNIGPVSVEDRTCTLTIRAATVDPDGMNTVPGRSYANPCGYQHGRPGTCGVDLSLHTYHGVVGEGSTRFIITDPGFNQTQAARVWIPSVLYMNSGALTNQSRPTFAPVVGQVPLRKPFYTAPAVGDKFSLVRRCLKNVEACQDFGNQDNYGGFHTTPKQPVNLRRELGP